MDQDLPQSGSDFAVVISECCELQEGKHHPVTPVMELPGEMGKLSLSLWDLLMEGWMLEGWST